MLATARTHQPATSRGAHRPAAPRPRLLAPSVLLWPDGGRILLEAGEGALADSFGGVLLDSAGGALVLTMDDALLAESGGAGATARSAWLHATARGPHQPATARQ